MYFKKKAKNNKNNKVIKHLPESPGSPSVLFLRKEKRNEFKVKKSRKYARTEKKRKNISVIS